MPRPRSSPKTSQAAPRVSWAAMTISRSPHRSASVTACGPTGRPRPGRGRTCAGRLHPIGVAQRAPRRLRLAARRRRAGSPPRPPPCSRHQRPPREVGQVLTFLQLPVARLAVDSPRRAAPARDRGGAGVAPGALPGVGLQQRRRGPRPARRRRGAARAGTGRRPPVRATRRPRAAAASAWVSTAAPSPAAGGMLGQPGGRARCGPRGQRVPASPVQASPAAPRSTRAPPAAPARGGRPAALRARRSTPPARHSSTAPRPPRHRRRAATARPARPAITAAARTARVARRQPPGAREHGVPHAPWQPGGRRPALR